MSITVADIDRWNVADLRAVFDAAKQRGGAAHDAAGGIAFLPAFESWVGQASDAAYEATTRRRSALGAQGEESAAVSRAVKLGADGVEAVKNKLAELREQAAQLGMQLNAAGTAFERAPGSMIDASQISAARLMLQPALNDLLADANAVDEQLTDAINVVLGEERGDRTIQAVDLRTWKESPGSVEAESNRRRNEIDAFTEVFGREPSSAADWTTAAALDPHSYDPMYQGVDAEIRVAEIEPVPGQGVVRVSQWIEQRDVTGFPPHKRDLGNNRTADPNFDPADTKVTTYIDYENGLVVVRQNPSVELNSDGGPGEVKIGVPEAVIQQNGDGAVRVKYEAGNPFAPWPSSSPPWPLEDNPWTVNGDLVFTPTENGIRVDGTRTNYPSMEVYQDLPNGTTKTVLIDPAESGRSWGPMANLPRHHDVGIGGSAFEPFDTGGGWNAKYDVRVPLPSTELGPTDDPPTVPVSPSPPQPGVVQF